MATRLNVEVIDTSEESRLTVSAVRQAVGDALGVNQRQTLIADVGGGSTLLTVLGERRDRHLAKPAAGLDPAAGDVLHQRGIAAALGRTAAAAHLQRDFHVSKLVPLDEIDSFVAVGGDARFAAREDRHAHRIGRLGAWSIKAAFDKLVDRCERHTAEELSKRHGLPFAEAETLNPALLVYQMLLHKTKAEQMIVSHVSMRDGLLLELAREVTGKEDEALLTGVIHSATAIAEKYHVDLNHARNVADVAVRLFDVFQADHGLGPRQRLLLRVAALLHEVGGFVSSRAHHKHSEYLIANSEIFGLNRNEITMVVADRPLPSPQRAAGVAPGVHGAAAGVAGGGEQAGGAAARGRRLDPRPSPPRRRHPFPAARRRVDRLPCPAGRRLAAGRAGDCRPRATCWRTSTA